MSIDHQLSAHALHLGYGERKVVEDLDLTIPQAQLTVIVGANACGKSTALRGLARLLAPRHGAVYLDGKPLNTMSASEIATILGVLPQTSTAPEGIIVADLVGRGRYPHQGWFRRWTQQDDRAVTEALEMTGTLGVADRPIEELSGGQRQRVWIAMALAQQTDILLLDEPTTFLDINHQVEVLDLLTDLVKLKGRTIVLVLHDLNLACRYADHIVAMKNGKVAAQGRPGEIVSESLVKDVFGLSARILNDPLSNTPMVVPIGRHHVPAAVAAEHGSERAP